MPMSKYSYAHYRKLVSHQVNIDFNTKIGTLVSVHQLCIMRSLVSTAQAKLHYIIISHVNVGMFASIALFSPIHFNAQAVQLDDSKLLPSHIR